MTVTSHQHVSRRLDLATVRSRVSVPLRFPDGFTADADVLTFHGLADGKEHLLLGLGGWEQALLHRESGRPAPLVRLHTANASRATCSAVNAATAVPSSGKAWRK
jgi:GTP cyclohydrolase II